MKKYFSTFIFLVYSIKEFSQFTCYFYCINISNKPIWISNIENLKIKYILKLHLTYTISDICFLLNAGQLTQNIKRINTWEFKELFLIKN